MIGTPSLVGMSETIKLNKYSVSGGIFANLQIFQKSNILTKIGNFNVKITFLRSEDLEQDFEAGKFEKQKENSQNDSKSSKSSENSDFTISSQFDQKEEINTNSLGYPEAKKVNPDLLNKIKELVGKREIYNK